MMLCLGVVLLAQAAANDKFLGSRLPAESGAAKHKEKLRSSLQAKLDEFAERYNISFQLGYRDHDVSLALAAGVEDHQTGQELTPSMLIPVGSATKTWTAAAVLQLADQGKVRLDDPLRRYVDPILLREHNTSLAELWKNPVIEEITVRQVLGHQSGVEDFDSDAVFNWTIAHPSEDYTPFMFLESANKSFHCKPGSCVRYSGVGFILLGYLLAEELSVDGSWHGYDQKGVIPEELRHDFPRARFPQLGKCSAIPGMVQQYAPIWKKVGTVDGKELDELAWQNVINYSCLNGWTMGNAALPAIEQANFLYYLLVSKKIISPEMVELMTQTKQWGDRKYMKYGLGLESDSFMTASGKERFHYFQHGGLDYGSAVAANVAVPELGFSLVVVVNSFTGMNCSLPDVNENQLVKYEWGLCNFLEPVLAVFEDEGRSRARLNCTSYAGTGWIGSKATCGSGWHLDQ